jgi:HK97 family phage major capsid protein
MGGDCWPQSNRAVADSAAFFVRRRRPNAEAAMPVTAKELREKRHKLVLDARKEILEKAEAENRDLSAEEQAAWTRVMGGTDPDGKTIAGEVDTLKVRIDRLEQSERIDAEFAQRIDPAPLIGRGPIKPTGTDGGALQATDRQRDLALRAWICNQQDMDPTEDMLEACKIVGLKPTAKALNFNLFEHNRIAAAQRQLRATRPDNPNRASLIQAAMGTTPGTAGGYMIPPETLMRKLEINMLWYGGMRQVAETINTTTGERMSWPTADDTGNAGIQLGESPANLGVEVDPTFGKVFWDAYKFSSKPILIPYELLQDAAFDVPSMIGEMFGVRLGRITNTKYTVGSGAATPKGMITAAATFAATSPTAIVADDLFGLYHSIDPAYRTNDCGFMLHDTILLALRKLKDGVGRYLWQDGLQNNTPDVLLGHGLTINNDMDSTTASGKKTLAWGQLFKYKIRRVGAMRMYRLEERYRDTDQDGFVALIREDGNLLTAGTPPVKVLLH